MTAPQSDPDAALLAAFRRAVAGMPWYRKLLAEQGVEPAGIVDRVTFSQHCPLLSKQNTFERFRLDELAATTRIADLAGVLTSSGHGQRFSFGLITHGQAAAGGQAIDAVLDDAFDVKSRSTLAINCLPMGVGFSSERMTVATTSVREDMAVALVDAFGQYYEQILLVADPLFMKRLLDYAAAAHVDWRRHRVQVVLGEETFGERFRDHVAAALGLDVAAPERGGIISSFGVGELGLHLCFETPATIALRRAAARDPILSRDLLGTDGPAPPAILTYHPQRTFVEAVSPDDMGYGRLTISMLDPELPVPLLRYQTGDRVRLLDSDAVRQACQRRDVEIPAGLPAALLALRGRESDELPNGADLGLYKDALYADPLVARHVTGAFRVAFDGTACTLHVQLTASTDLTSSLEPQLLASIPLARRPREVVFWPYASFPFGMTLDYERKFAYVARPRGSASR